MALDPNINRIKFLRSTTAGNKPTVAMLAEGEIAINLADKTIYSTDGTNIIDLGFGLGGNVKGNIDASGYIKAANVVQSDYLHLAPKIGITTTNGQGDGISLYQGWTAQNNMPAYGLAFAQSATFGGHGAVSANDWATYFTMNGGASRGWIFKSHGATPGVGNVASISAAGIATFTRVDAPVFGNASSASRLETPRLINGVSFNGTANIDTPATLSVLAADNRIIKPSGTRKSAVSAYFATKAGLTGLAGDDYGDFLALNTYENSSGGLATGLFFPKYQGANPVVYQADHNSNTWGLGKQLAFITDNVKSATRLAKSGRWVTGVPNTGWWRLASVVIPQNGFDMRITMVGGSGYGTAFESNGTTEITLRSGNANPKALTGVAKQLDGHTSITGLAYNNTGGDTWEIWVGMGAYSTYYYTVDYEEGTDFTDAFAFHNTTQPPGTTNGNVHSIAKLTSNVASATKLQTARNINGVPFDGTQDIRIQSSSVRIASGDLNNILSEGNYYCDADADAVNIANKPMEGSFALEVLRTAGYIQRFTHYNSGRTFIRKSYTGFGTWAEVALSTQSNVFLASQTIDAGAVSFLQMTGTEEAAVVLQKPGKRAVLTIPADNSVGLLVDGGWLFNSPSFGNLNFHANTAVLDSKLFRLQGAENDPIDRVQNPNAAITVNSPEPAMAAIRNALDFGWYNDHFQLGTIRSGSQASHGFGITKGNNDLLWRVSPQGDNHVKGAVFAGAFAEASAFTARNGRFQNDAHHYLDVGQPQRDMFTLAVYGGAYDFLNTATGGATVRIRNDSVSTTMPIWPTGTSNHSDSIASIETTAGIRNATTIVPNGGSRYKAFVHGSMQSTDGYRTHVAFGVSKRSTDWSAAGAVIAVGGSDTNPVTAFYFDNNNYLRTSSGRLYTDSMSVKGVLDCDSNVAVAGDFSVSGAIRTPSSHIQFLTPTGQARAIATGGILVSNAYADTSLIPENGIYSKGDIRTPNWLIGYSIAAQNNLNMDGAVGGGNTNGLRKGTMDGALYAGCNWDIQTHNGLGIIDYSGARKIVFEARAGTIHAQGDLNIRNVAANGNISSQGNISASGSISSQGAVTAQGGVYTGSYRLPDESGWTTLPNGAIMQWGTVFLSSPPAAGGYGITFPMRFPNGCRSITANRMVATDASNTAGQAGINVNTFNQDGATFVMQNFNNNTRDIRGFTWMAIGY